MGRAWRWAGRQEAGSVMEVGGRADDEARYWKGAREEPGPGECCRNEAGYHFEKN